MIRSKYTLQNYLIQTSNNPNPTYNNLSESLQQNPPGKQDSLQNQQLFVQSSQPMTQKFTYDGYTLCVTFRSDNALSMTASHNLTGEHFINDMIELGKIKKDTVLATLGRKSEKHLWCTFKMVDSEPRKLIVSFVVKFDFLPEFNEDITLEYVEVKGEVFNKISSAEFKSDIDEIEKVLDSIKQKGAIMIEQKTSSVTRKTAITEFDLRKGTFLLQLTGVLTNASAVGDTIQFTVEQEGEQPIVLKQKSHSQHGYAYPFFISHKIESRGGNVKIHGENSQNGTATLSSEIITLIPIISS